MTKSWSLKFGNVFGQGDNFFFFPENHKGTDSEVEDSTYLILIFGS